METSSIIKHLLIDDDSLQEYYSGILVDYSSIKRRVFLLERNESKVIPDHYYKLSQEKTFQNLGDSVAGVLTNGLAELAKEYLEFRGKRIYVKQSMQNGWQGLITRMPPLVLHAALLHSKYPLVVDSIADVQRYAKNYILPNIRYTALSHPYLPQMEEFISSNKGLHDLHMHLNNATETDSTWQDFLDTPEKIYHDLEIGFKNQLVREQFEQESTLLSPLRFYDLIRIARRIRNYLFEMVCHDSVCTKEKDTELKLNSPRELLLKILDLNNPEYNGLGNPFISLLDNSATESCCPMVVECLMYIKVFKYISEHPRESVSGMFHFYLLILGLANRLLVQQTHQYGFQQFKKHTVDELRSESERTYYKRFLQLQGNELRNLRFLEGRFSPKDTQAGNETLISKIEKGWEQLLKHFDENDNEKPELKLIAHFIKEEDKNPESDYRHQLLRSNIWNKATVLGIMYKNHHPLMKNFVGIDAASSEFDTPPEVFAPSFRILRRRGIKNFTFHAGEDFFHIIGGLRAIYETIDFMEFRNGDRIGHAVASGLDPQIWINNVGEEILIRQGNYMDDLLFAYHFIVEHEIVELKTCLPFIANKVADLSFAIYGNYFPNDLLIKAWKLRKYCPMLLLASEREYAEPYRVFCDEEFQSGRKTISDITKDKRIEVLRLYHRADVRKKYKEIIKIKVEDILSVEGIRALQKGVLKLMHEKEIVIETLPTSNVRIGNHHNFDTYHLYNWLNWKEEGLPIPPIVVGTDDTGIFATNIYNEYANIYCNLTHHHQMGHDKVMNLIREFDNNAKVYKFK